jgi:hypothetical protein
MKLLKLNKINNIVQKYSSLILSSLLLLSKKEKASNIILYSIISIIGYLFMNKKNGDKDIISKDWKDFINKQVNKNEDFSKSNTLENNDEDNDYYDNSSDDDEENNKENSKENNIEIIKELINKNKNPKINKIINKKLNEKAYPNNINELERDYDASKKESIFKLKVNDNNKNTPIFNLRSSDNIDFYWNFHLHNADNNKINSLILCRDIHQWMNNSSLSNEDLEDQCYPLYLILKDHKTNNEIMIFEAYKIFVYPNENGNKHAFITKGDNYKTIEEILNILIDSNYIQDLLNDKEYESYNLTTHDSVCLFLNNLLSHFLPYDVQGDELIKIDLEQYNENMNTFDYFYHTNTLDSEMFNTNI